MVSNLDGVRDRGQKQTGMIIMNLAFDIVSYMRLLCKFDHYGIRGSTHKGVSSWLACRIAGLVACWFELGRVPFPDHFQ